MTPAELRATNFTSYPPLANQVATAHLELLRQLPLAFAGVLLREIVAYDWRFPAERRQIDGQLMMLGKLSPDELAQRLVGFSSLRLSPELMQSAWVTDPADFMERLTAWLWSSHQMDSFRQTAETYTAYLSEAMPLAAPSQPRLGVVVIGRGVDTTQYPLFRKLRPHGVYLTKVQPAGGLATLLEATSQRADAGGDRFDHWYIDGGVQVSSASITQISYAALERPRALLLDRTQRAIESGSMGPEALRSLLAHLKPGDIGLQGKPDDSALDHFQLALLSEGSGTQIFATTFVQWAARECLRRAQPETLLVRYAPRQRMQTMNEMLSASNAAAPDPQGSLVDADMGAYYTWLNMTRLSGSDQLRFLVWFEEHREAVVVGPGLPRGTSSDSPMDMRQVLRLLA